MRAVIYRSVGTLDDISVEEVPIPEPGYAEVRIKVQAAALNPTDIAAWSGRFPAPPEGDFFGIGWDIAGVVDVPGPGTVWQPGQAVIAISAGAVAKYRAQAEYVIVPSHALAPAPEGIDPTAASTIPLNGLTAAQSVELLRIEPGTTVLVTGGQGAVGAYAVQLAKRRGATVIACGRSADGAFATDIAGADEYLISDDALVGAIRSRYPNGVDGVIDTAMLGDEVLGAVRDGGAFVSTRIDALPQSERGIRVRLTQIAADGAMLTTLSDLAARGELALRVAASYPLNEARAAHAHLASGEVSGGRIVLTVP